MTNPGPPASVGSLGDDPGTVAYFDAHGPEYGLERVAFAGTAIRRRAAPGASLVDLGCGAGNTLADLSRRTGISDLCGVDVSTRQLEQTRERVAARTHLGSLLDPELPTLIGRRFDFAVLSAVLHHLIAPTRRASRDKARRAVRVALDLLEPDGHLVVVEPVWSPGAAMDALFYVKRALSSVTARRIELGGRWNNIGAPVVSYYTSPELTEMVAAGGRAEIVEREEIRHDLGRIPVLRRADVTLVARRAG